MGPIVRYLGKLVPKETLIWQDPTPAIDHPLIGEAEVAVKSLGSGLSVPPLASERLSTSFNGRLRSLRTLKTPHWNRLALAPQSELAPHP